MATKESEKKVSVIIPKGKGNEDPNFYVGVNGVNYLIPRGKKTEVPDFVAFEIERAQGAQDAKDEDAERRMAKATM